MQAGRVLGWKPLASHLAERLEVGRRGPGEDELPEGAVPQQRPDEVVVRDQPADRPLARPGFDERKDAGETMHGRESTAPVPRADGRASLVNPAGPSVYPPDLDHVTNDRHPTSVRRHRRPRARNPRHVAPPASHWRAPHVVAAVRDRRSTPPYLAL